MNSQTENQTMAVSAIRPGCSITKRLINKKTLHAMVPLSATTIDVMEKEGKFPKRFALSARSVVWDEDDVVAWIEARKEAGLQASRPGIMPA